jgi:hypothetical protein
MARAAPHGQRRRRKVPRYQLYTLDGRPTNSSIIQADTGESCCMLDLIGPRGCRAAGINVAKVDRSTSKLNNAANHYALSHTET